MTGERRIPASRLVVWEALNDPAVLKASIPGCETLDKLSDTQMKATAAVKIGPMSARFTGNVQLTDIDAPNGYTIGGEGQGGAVGFAKGGAKVKLDDDGPATVLRYEVHAQVGGKIAQLGARLIDATAKQMADAFFDRFSVQVQALAPPQPTPVIHEPVHVIPPQPMTPPPPPQVPAQPPSAVSILDLVPREPFGLPLAAWIGGAVYLFIILLFIGSML